MIDEDERWVVTACYDGYRIEATKEGRVIHSYNGKTETTRLVRKKVVNMGDDKERADLIVALFNAYQNDKR